ncbi:F-box protein At2g05970-like [Carex rostrata]
MKKKHKPTVSITGSNRAGWSHLLPDLLEQIFVLLRPIDRYYFRQICSRWRSFAKKSIPLLPYQFYPPRLLLTRPDNGLSLFDIFYYQSRFSLPPPHCRARCFGYHAGWFFLVSDKNPSRACLFNPVLLSEIHLPDLDSPIEKAILSAPPGSPNCVVAVMGRSTFIALCEPPGKRWQVLDLGQPILFKDIIFWRNQLCGIENLGNVLFCNFDMKSRRTSIIKVEMPELYRYTSDAFLVESTGGDLLTVLADDYTLESVLENNYTLLRVFKLDQQCTWEYMEQIGDQALFLGKLRSESVAINAFLDSGIKGNSIYWTRTSKNFEGLNGIVIYYSMEDRSVDAVPVYGQYRMRDEPVWVSPVIPP